MLSLKKNIICFESGSLAQIYNNKSMILNICSPTATKVSPAEEVTDKLVFNDNSSLSTVSIPQSGTNDLKSTREDMENKWKGFITAFSKAYLRQYQRVEI